MKVNVNKVDQDFAR